MGIIIATCSTQMRRACFLEQNVIAYLLPNEDDVRKVGRGVKPRRPRNILRSSFHCQNALAT